MSTPLNDPIGQAILDYVENDFDNEIVIHSDICDDDVIPVPYLFRTYDDMPELEKKALNLCQGKVLDVGAGSGTHAKYLKEKGFDVHCIDTSNGAVLNVQRAGVSAERANFFHLQDGDYDTLLMLMNGMGIAGKLSNLEATLTHAKKLLNNGGRIICDSSDIQFLYMDDDGSMWIDLNTEYYGNFRYQMSYKAHKSDWFDWLYVDFENLKKIGEQVGFKVINHFEENNQFLAELILEEKQS